MKMERARSAVTNFFGRVPLTYTRFSLTPQTDGDASQVEMKLADEEECGDQVLGDHVVRHRSGNGGCKNLCFKILAAVLLFLIGFLLGYLVYRGRQQCLPALVETNPEDESYTEMSSDAETEVLDMSTLKPMLNQKVDGLQFERSIDELSRNSREAGSDNEDVVAQTVREEFMKMPLDKVWIDEHYVTLQDNGRSNTITVLKADGSIDETFNPSAYVAYSPAASVTAGLVYSHYGRIEDFDKLRAKNIDLVGKLILVRSGLIPFSEKVKNAENFNAAGVLIYPDPSDFTFPDADAEKEIESPFGHAHYGTGDPFTPGFPSFNHTQFPPSKSSGLPGIPVQSLSSKDGKALLRKLDSNGCPDLPYGCKLGQQYKNITLEVKNTFAEKKIYNIFGVIKGFDEPDRYVVVGAQRDSWGPGVGKAVVGSSVLVELARVLSDMVKTDGYKPRRSIVFASWSAGDYGSVGATEWLEGYLTTLHLKAISYINLDAVVQGYGSFQMLASPTLYTLAEKVMKEITYPSSTKSLYEQFTPPKPKDCIGCFSMDDTAYPFLAFSGIPSVSFSFRKDNKPYAYLGTSRDNFETFKKLGAVDSMCRTAVKFAAQIILRLTHDHVVPLDYTRYKTELLKVSSGLNSQSPAITARGLTLRWINSAWGDFSRAATSLKESFSHSDLENKPILRSLNDRVMKVEHALLSPYASPKETPFCHVLYGIGDHTVSALMNHLQLLISNESLFNDALFKNQLALLTWTLQGAANALAGEVWEIDNEF